MAGFFVPIATGSIDNLNDTIAKGSDLSFIGNLPDAYWKGQQARYQQDQRDAFKNGLPRDASGNIDWNAVGDTLARVGGTGQIQGIIGLQNLDISRNALRSLDNSGVFGPTQGNLPPSTAPAIPQRQSVAPSGPVLSPQPTAGDADVSAGTKMPPGQNLTSGEVTGIKYSPATGGITAREIGARTGADPQQIAQGLGVSIDEVIDPTNPAVRQKLVQIARGSAAPQAAPQQQPQQAAPSFDQRFAQAETQPQPQAANPVQAGNINEATAAAYEARANQAFKLATGLSFSNPQAGARLQALGEQLMKQAQTIRSALAKNAELTNEQKNANASGVRSPRDYANITESDKQDSDTFQKRYTTLQATGEQAYNGLQKAQLMKNLTLQPSFYSGPLHEGVQTFNQFRSIFGANPSSALPTEAFNKVANDMLQEQVKAMGGSGVGRVLQSEVNIMKQAIASLGITPQSNRALAEMISRVYGQNQAIAEIARNVPRAPGQMNRQLDTAVSQYLKSHPLFTQQELQHPETLGAPDAPPQSAQWSPQQKRQWAASVGLKPGDPIRFNGQVVQVP